MSETTFRICSTCKKPIGFETPFFVCSVSTCNHKRVGLYFCSVPCWDAHVPEARHRDAWAESRTSPSAEEWARQRAREEAESARVEAPPEPARRRIVATAEDDVPREILVVVSKLKAYVKARSGMNTSDSVASVLSDHLRRLCDDAIRKAAEDGRKTVLDRDVPPPRPR